MNMFCRFKISDGGGSSPRCGHSSHRYEFCPFADTDDCAMPETVSGTKTPHDKDEGPDKSEENIFI